MSGPLEQGIKFFNRGSYFEAHEAWEEMWRSMTGSLRDFYQGLVHAAVGMHHLANRNPRGAVAQLEKSLRRLDGYPADCCSIDVAQLRKDIRRVLEQVNSGTDTEFLSFRIRCLSPN